MHAAFDRPDRCWRTKRSGRHSARVLHRHLDVDAVALGVGGDDRMERVFFFVEPLDERNDAAIERVGRVRAGFASFVAQYDR